MPNVIKGKEKIENPFNAPRISRALQIKVTLLSLKDVIMEACSHAAAKIN